MAAILEPAQAGELMRAIHDYSGQPVTRAALLLSALLFQRPGNMQAMQWNELDCKLGANEIYGRIKGTKTDLTTLATDPTDYKALIAQAKGTSEKLALAQKLATRRLAFGVVPELDACFAALEFEP
ncbi:hypothetical protein [Verminephrobacter eiseniae]|uniref:Uncharacterized protein n=1 Tax=Verminephrobacter eiseniae (strain EF01-2) TaxID=391735 RepID=A1WIZ9_VEREI|nr:hypothetical protein [Verminephrobacter eiseniae]ABM57606.1 hypothetical protein Veis_1853 [Verminephrobacter eiseniae EF01-2]